MRFCLFSPRVLSGRCVTGTVYCTVLYCNHYSILRGVGIYVLKGVEYLSQVMFWSLQRRDFESH